MNFRAFSRCRMHFRFASRACLLVLLAAGPSLGDPGEVNNLWNESSAAELKNELIRKLLFAEMGKESLPMPRIAGA